MGGYNKAPINGRKEEELGNWGGKKLIYTVTIWDEDTAVFGMIMILVCIQYHISK